MQTSGDAGAPPPALSTALLQDRDAEPGYRAPRANVTLADFDIMTNIGDGSFATVILAAHKATGAQYAIKVINKHLVMRNKMVEYVKAERSILDALDYDGVARLHFTFQDADFLYMGMEYCAGGELYDQIQKRGPLPLDTARFYAAELVLILEYLKSKDVAHRDLKPENLLLSAEGHLKIIDFGSARAGFVERPAANSRRSGGHRATSFVGTAEYVSPEVLANTPAGCEADLWALGCILFQLITGKPPFRAGSEYLTFQKVSDRDFAFPDDFPPLAKDLVDKLLVLEPSERLGAQSFDDLKRHSFFESIDWSGLRSGPAPTFRARSPPPSDEAGLDWDLNSLVAAQGAPLQYAHG